MKRLAIAILSGTLVLVAILPVLGSQAAGAQQKKPPSAPPLLNLLQGFYINNLQQALELTDEQYPRVANSLKEFVRETYDIEVPQKNKATNQLKQGVNRGASEDELARLIKEFDQIYADDHAARERFFVTVDPLLQISQRAKLRLYVAQKELQVQHLIQVSQGAPGNAPAPAPPAAPTKPSPNQ